ncbi:hypothetical protein Vretifemale_10765 [Volvox reticuliferus]|uniref:Uncharacterized protein n=1 Tax=Volvox reticuliferus TaxID=1737510 RepID=A0A8J4FQF5_9CHLO|nr:hypothetical protein Vretifemale_10765 [Volvox reticuliferus]
MLRYVYDCKDSLYYLRLHPQNIYHSTLRAAKGFSHRSLLRSYVQAVHGHEEDDAARNKAYSAVLKAHEEELASDTGAIAAAAARPLLGNPMVGTQAVIGMLAGLPMQLHLQPLGLNLQPERLSPQDKLRLALLQQHHINLQQLKQKQQQQEQEQKQQRQQESHQRRGEAEQELHAQQPAHGSQQLPMLTNGTAEETGVTQWQRVFQPPEVEPIGPANPEVATAEVMAALATAVALERVSATVSRGVPAGSGGRNVAGNGTGSVEAAPGVQPAPTPQPLSNSTAAMSVGQQEHDRPDKTRVEEAGIGNGQIEMAEAGGAVRRDVPNAAPYPAGRSGGLGNVGMTAETQQQQQLLRTIPPSLLQAPASIGNRKRPLGPAPEVPSAKHPKRRPLAIARINQVRREGLFESDDGELNSPPQQSLGPAGSPGAKGLPTVAEGLRQAPEQDERQEQHRAPERKSIRQRQRQQLLLPQQKHQSPPFSPLPGQRTEQSWQPLLPYDGMQKPEQEPLPRGQQWQPQDAEDGGIPLADDSATPEHLMEERALQQQLHELQQQVQEVRRRLQQQPDASRERNGAEGLPPAPLPIPPLRRKSKRKAAALAPAAWGRAVVQGRQGTVEDVAKRDGEERELEEEAAARERERKEEEEDLMRQDAEAFGEEDWQEEEMLGADVFGRVSLMPGSGRKRPRRVDPDIASMLDTMGPAPPIDPPMVLLRRPDGGPPILCVAVPLGTLTNHAAALVDLAVGDLPPGSNLAADLLEDNAAEARGVWPPPMVEKYLPQQPRGAYMDYLIPAKGPGREAPDRRRGFEALAAAAAAAAAMVGSPPAGRIGTPGDARKAASTRSLGSGPWVAAVGSRAGTKSMQKTRGRAGPAKSMDSHRAAGNLGQATEVLAAPATGASGAGADGGSCGRPGAGQKGSWRQEAAAIAGPQRGIVRGVMTAGGAEGDVSDAEVAPAAAKEPEVWEPPQPTAPRDPRRKLLSRGGGVTEAGGGGGGGKRGVGGRGGEPAAERATTGRATTRRAVDGEVAFGFRNDAEREDGKGSMEAAKLSVPWWLCIDEAA